MVGKFGPGIVRELSLREHIPSTFMFMGSFGEKFEYTFTEMGGLRLITGCHATSGSERPGATGAHVRRVVSGSPVYGISW